MRLGANQIITIRNYTRQLALALNVIGLVNLQFAIQRRSGEADKVFDVLNVLPRFRKEKGKLFIGRLPSPHVGRNHLFIGVFVPRGLR